MLIRVMPRQADRVETGPIRFGADLPGLFLRGEEASARAEIMRYIARHESKSEFADWLREFADTLDSCAMHEMRESA